MTLYPLGPALPLTNRHSVLQGAVTSDTHPRFLGTLLSSASEEMLPQTNTRRFWGPPMTKGAPHAIWTSIVPYFHNTGWMMCLRGRWALPHPHPQIQHPSPICCAWCQSQHHRILSHPGGSECFPVTLALPRVSVGCAVSLVSMGACRLPSWPVECLPPPSSRWYDNEDTGDLGRGASHDGASGPCGEGPGQASPTHQGVPTAARTHCAGLGPPRQHQPGNLLTH